ncbi:MAG: phosphodiester glycosidase family protein [Armatimonadota bacterium]
MKKLVAIILIFIFLTGLVFAEESVRVDNSANELLLYKYGYYKQKVRLVFETSKVPEYSIYLSNDGKEITVDFVNTGPASSFKLTPFRYDYLVSGIEQKTVNFRRVQFVIKFKYKITQANIEDAVFKNPDRLVIDIFREYTVTNNLYLTKNIVLTQKLVIGQKDKLWINELLIDKNAPGVSFNVVLANDDTKSRGKLSEMVVKKGALAGINGGYFARGGGPLGLVIIDGKVVSDAVKTRPARTAFGITKDKKIIFDRIFSKNGRIFTKDGSGDWSDVVYALGAGPRLIKDGKIHITAMEEKLGKGGNDITSKNAGRSSLGVTKDDKLVFMTVSGYTSNEGQGIRLYSLANRLRELGVMQGMNLDGGGSTLMCVEDNVISAPPEAKSKFERKIADGFLVFDESPNLMPSAMRIEVLSPEVTADGESMIGVNAFVFDRQGNPVPPGTPVFFYTENGRISVSAKTVNDGMAHAYFKIGRKLGYWKVTARCGFVEAGADVLFKAGEPKYIFTDIERNDKDKYELQILVNDRYYNPVWGKEVNLVIGNDKKRLTTDKDGIVKLNIVKETPGKIKINIESEGLEPVEVSI